MDIPGVLFSPYWLVLGHAVFALALADALRHAPWDKLREGWRLNLFAGACAVVLVLWQMRAGVTAGLTVHLLGATLLTMMFGGQLALIGLAVVIAISAQMGHGDWAAFGINGLLLAVLPVWFARRYGAFVAARLPRNPFVYLFACGFAGAALAIALVGCVSAVLLLAATEYGLDQVVHHYLVFYLLMVFPEAFLTGMCLTLFVVYRPDWVATFDDRRYLHSRR